jgi:hypothetical protein
VDRWKGVSVYTFQPVSVEHLALRRAVSGSPGRERSDKGLGAATLRGLAQAVKDELISVNPVRARADNQHSATTPEPRSLTRCTGS